MKSFEYWSPVATPRGSGGYSLVELVVVMCALALVAGTMLSVSTMKLERRQACSIADKLDALDEALLNYYEQFGHLPCPASASEPENTSSFGRATDCTAEHLSVRGRTRQDSDDRGSAESLTRLHGHSSSHDRSQSAAFERNTTGRSDFFPCRDARCDLT